MTSFTRHVTILTRFDESGPGDPRTAWHARRNQLDNEGADYTHNDSNLTIQIEQGDRTIFEAYRKAEE